MTIFFPQLLQAGLHYDVLGTGVRLMVWTSTFILVAPAVGALVDRIGERPLMVSGVQSFMNGFGPAIWVSSGLALAGAICGLALPARHRHEVVAAIPSSPERALEWDQALPRDARSAR